MRIENRERGLKCSGRALQDQGIADDPKMVALLDAVAERAATKVAEMAVDGAMIMMEHKVVGLFDERAVITEQPMEARLKELSNDINERFRTLSTTRSVVSVAPSAVPAAAILARTSDNDLVPQHLTVKWFKGYPVPDDMCVTSGEAEQWLRRFWSQSPVNLTMVGKQQTRDAIMRVTNSQIMNGLQPKPEGEAPKRLNGRAWDLKESIDSIIARGRPSSLYVHDVQPKVKVNASPERERML